METTWNYPLLLQTYFIVTAVTPVLLNLVPHLRDRLVLYGSRSESVANSSTHSPVSVTDHKSSSAGSLDIIASIKVPHNWFLHFYIVSVSSSIFWAYQILTHGYLLRLICGEPDASAASNSMTADQIVVTWLLMTVQGLRRLYESIVFRKDTGSFMFVAHWMLGISFYLAMSIAVWIEGAGTLADEESFANKLGFPVLSIRRLLTIPVFLLASGVQYDCHAYLASLRKYTLPAHPVFQTIVCPHYTMECLIYLMMAFIGAPPGHVVNRTLFTALVFVVSNLAVTAASTKTFYFRKFGYEKVANRWIMVPWIW